MAANSYAAFAGARSSDITNPGETMGLTASRSKQSPGHLSGVFGRFAAAVATYAGRPVTFLIACVTIVVWALSGPVFHYSDTWQLVINTSTTIITILMVFVIQNAQNRDAMAIQVKLDELICATRDAREKIVGIEDMDDTVVKRLKDEIKVRAADTTPIENAGTAG